MSGITRRAAIAAAAAVGATALAPRIGRTSARVLAIYDSRLAEGRVFAAAQQRLGAALHDISGATAHAPAIPRGGKIVGLTAWSDWVGLRGQMLERGLRVRAERRLPHRGSRGGTPFEWAMA